MQWNPCKAVPALAACLLSIHLGAAVTDAGHYTIQDEKQESTFLETYKAVYKYHDPNTPPGEEPVLIPIPGGVEESEQAYNVNATGDPGVFRHSLNDTVQRANGQQYPGFTAYRYKKVGANQWIAEEELSYTWHPN